MSAGHTPGIWMVANMVHAERSDQMTPEEIGEYVSGCVRVSRERSGFDHFLFITTDGEGPDICHVGNGPAGPANARLIAAAPELLEALRACADVLHSRIPRLHPEGPNSLEEQTEYEEVGGTWSMAADAIAKATGAASQPSSHDRKDGE